ncbi:hypothetical protein BGZ76_002663, partial [Entomortierella beljakovae]
MSRALSLSKVLLASTFLIARTHGSKALLAYIIYTLFKYRNTALGIKPRSDIPGPKGHPLIGNTIFMMKRPEGQHFQIQTKLHEQYGKVYTFTIAGFSRVISIRDPELIDHVLRTNFWKYEKGEFFRTVLSPLIGDGIFGADALEMAKKIGQSYLYSSISKAFYQRCIHTFGEVAFGQSFGCLKDPSQEVDFAKAFDRMSTNLMKRFKIPYWRTSEWWTGRDKVIEKDVNTIANFAYDVIRKRRDELKKLEMKTISSERDDVDDMIDGLKVMGDGDSVHSRSSPSSSPLKKQKSMNQTTNKKKDLMQLFMDTEDENGDHLSDEMLKDTLLNFILAGRDTTAQALSWMFYLILRSGSRHEILDRLVSEIDSTLDNSPDGSSARPTYDTIKTQKYAEACFYEALRLYPSVPHNIKLCVEDDVLPGGIPVHKGEVIAWGSWAMGRDKSVFGPDAYEYNPERWLKGEKFSPSKFVAFNMGPRT